MTPEEIDRLIHAYRDGTLSREEGERLAQAIRGGGELSGRILRELEFSGLLSRALEASDEEAFVRSFAERVHAEETESEFVRALERRNSWRHYRSPAPKNGWLAAALLLGAVLLLAYLFQRTVPDGPAAPNRPAPELGRVPAAPAEEPPSISQKTPPAPPPLDPRPPEVPPAPEPVRPLALDPEPARPPDPPALPVPGDPAVPTLPTTVEAERPVGVLALGSVQGSVYLVEAQERRGKLQEGSLRAGQGLECAGPGSGAVGVFGDGTRLEIGPETQIREVAERAGNRGKRIFLVRGTLQAEVARQPAETPMVIATPHGEARILGTKLRLSVDPDPRGFTRLEVTEGKVRLTRLGGKFIDVGAGSYASCGPGVEPASRPIHPDDIVLLPLQAKLVGDEWILLRDRNASSGLALEVAKSPYKAVDAVEKRPSYAIFSFYASAEREYRLWVRTASQPTSDPWLREYVTVEPQNCALNQNSRFFGTYPTTAYVFTGISAWSGYAWASGVFEESKPETQPVALKFQRTGMQTLRLFSVHPSIRIDAVWLSSRQSTRPSARQSPPSGDK